MSCKNMIIDLKVRKDNDGAKYLIGKIKAPIHIDCSQGCTFLIFFADEGAEQLQIAPMDSGKDREKEKVIDHE